MSTIQLRPIYPTAEEVAERQACALVQRHRHREERRQLFVDTEPADMHISYAEYEKYLVGHSYESIAHERYNAYKQWLVQKEKKAFEAVQALYRWKNLLNETRSYYMRSTAKERNRLNLQVAQAIGRWRSLSITLHRYI